MFNLKTTYDETNDTENNNLSENIFSRLIGKYSINIQATA